VVVAAAAYTVEVETVELASKKCPPEYKGEEVRRWYSTLQSVEIRLGEENRNLMMTTFDLI
jgi:hypothetical protein